MSRDHSLINALFAWLNISSFQMSKIIPILVPYPIFFSARVAFQYPQIQYLDIIAKPDCF